MLALQLSRARNAADLNFIIRKHQSILLFRNKMAAILSESCLLKTLIYNLTLTLSLYQLSTVKEIDQRAFQLIFQWLVIVIMLYSLTTSSERIDAGNDILYSAIVSFEWYAVNFSKSDAKSLQLLTQMCQKPVRLIYYGGAMDICYSSFLGVLRFSYSLFTLLKQSIQ